MGALDFRRIRSGAAIVNQAKPFARSLNDRMLAGVMGGIAHRFGWNSTLLRAVFVIVSIASAAFPGILVYLILWLLMPNEAD
jgi:phage shock protein C